MVYLKRQKYYLKGWFKVITLENNYLMVEINEFGAEMQSVVDRITNYEFM